MEYKEYQYMLSRDKKSLGLTWGRISELIEEKHGVKISADYIRHEHYALKKQKDIVEKDINTKILALSDLHYPFNVNLDFLIHYKEKVDVLVINGDEQDCQGISKFSKHYRVDFMQELIGAREMLIEIIEMVRPKKVIFTKGNHNLRMIRYFASRLDSDTLGLMPETNLDLIVNDGFTEYNRANKTKTYFEPLCSVFKDIEVVYNGSWYEKVGRTIFAHPEAYKSGILSTTEKCWQYFNQIREDFDTLVVAHTHHLGYAGYGSYHFYESGAMCKQMDYAEGRLIKPQSKGYVLLCQDVEGSLIYDRTKLIRL